MTHAVDLRTGCWVWTGPTCANGRYGRIPGTKPLLLAHRKAFMDAIGPIPAGMVICHSCDNGLCVNPMHLFVGTQKDNMLDCTAKGRNRTAFKDQSGERNANSKYTREFADRVRSFHAETQCSYQQLADHFEMKSKGHAYNIVRGRIWT